MGDSILFVVGFPVSEGCWYGTFKLPRTLTKEIIQEFDWSFEVTSCNKAFVAFLIKSTGRKGSRTSRIALFLLHGSAYMDHTDWVYGVIRTRILAAVEHVH